MPAFHAHGTDSRGPEHKAALLGRGYPESHGLHAVHGHISTKPQPISTPQEGPRAAFAGSPAGQAAHALPAPTNTSAPPPAQAHAVSPQMQPPGQEAAAVPSVPFGHAPEERPGHWAEHPGGVPGQIGQHAHQNAGGPTHKAPSEAQHEATQ